MAFFRNHTSNMDSGHDLNEKAEDNKVEGAYGNRGMDVSLSEKDNRKTEEQYQSDEEPLDAGRQQSDASGGNDIGRPGRRMGPSGTWGSSFWKDCQPIWGSKNEDNGDKKEMADGNSSEDGEQSLGGQVDVPADEMLSDDYYEQDGEEQSSSLQRRGLNCPSTSGSRLPPKPFSKSRNITKSSKAVKYDEYGDDEDYEESEDVEEEDDPDDADVEPDFDEASKGIKKKGNWVYQRDKLKDKVENLQRSQRHLMGEQLQSSSLS